MPRTSRQHSDTGVYHVMLRGIDRQDIFADDQDRGKLHQKNRPFIHSEKYNQLKKEYEKLNSRPNKTKEKKMEQEKIKRQMNRARQRKDFNGENHANRDKHKKRR